ncbi:MAG: xanthine dehydrogenase molybdopterin binding subunit, partial [Bacteroidales bacterium]|nr:xanthine dehydrogenase molybdopterin binding subunit [Bacteroidales bacterium]
MSKAKDNNAIKHVTGESVYVNDINVNDHLFGKIVYSRLPHAIIKSFDLSKARSLQGVYAVLCSADIPGKNQMGPVVQDESCLAEREITFAGQAIFLIAAENEDIAKKAEYLIEIEFEELESITDLKTAIQKNNLLFEPQKIETGNVENALKNSKHHLSGSFFTGAQEHWYLETQSCLAIPGEGKEIEIFSSTQHPSETQSIVAGVLGINKNEVEVEVRRLGGAFGGKETQGNHYAAWAALLANVTNRPVKIHLSRNDDQLTTGKRHPFLSNYIVGFDDNGIINSLDVEMNCDAGSSNDLTDAILARALFHIDNSYFIPNLRVIGKAYKTNLPSNTAFRGFGGPQGMAVIENIIDRIARFLQIDATKIRYRNFYQINKNNITHYGQKIENNRLLKIYDEIIKSSNYFKRRKEISEFNSKNEFFKKGIALSPVKFGISFTTSFLNQAGALVHIYKDGTVQVNHGGIEMGQGLNTKILGIASDELGINSDDIKVTSTNTSKVPNTSATAASSGSDLNGMAVKNAIDKLKKRLTEIAYKIILENTKIIKEDIIFHEDFVFDKNFPEAKISFKELINSAYLNQISLSATGFYRTPGIHFDKKKAKGKPFYYFAFGMSVSEVQIDTLTGVHKILRTDILHDAGNPLNEEIDIGQIEGGFIQGVGWCTTEEMKWDKNGKLLTFSPDTYKIPLISDIPKDFRVKLLKDAPNINVIKKSKAVGEPPFMHCFSVWLAIKDAISSIGNH